MTTQTTIREYWQVGGGQYLRIEDDGETKRHYAGRIGPTGQIGAVANVHEVFDLEWIADWMAVLRPLRRHG